MDHFLHCPRRFGMLFAVVALTLGCHELPENPGEGVVVLELGALQQVNPSDVAVAPLAVMPGIDAPIGRLRQAIAAGLPARQYTPLSLDFVDSRVIEASYNFGALGEEAVCQVTVHGWNETRWDTGHAIDVDLEMAMIDPRAPEGPALWSGRLTKTIDMTKHRHEVVTPVLYERAVTRAATELLAALPERKTAPGGRR